MTVAEMHTYFKVLIDKEDSLNFPNFKSEHIDYFLNEGGQDRLVKLTYSGRPFAKGQAFEETQKRTDDLRVLITNTEIDPEAVSLDNKPNSRFFTLPANYWFAVNEEATVEYEACDGQSTTKRLGVKPTTHDDYNKVIRDPFKRPGEKEVLRLMFQDKAEIIGSATVTPSKYILRYLRRPQRISLSLGTDCELPEHLHQEIVQLAVSAAIRTTQDDTEYRKMLSELSTQE